jgi:putative transposase
MDLQYSEHHVYRLEHHLVWTPKYRNPVFREPYRTDLKGMIVKAAYDYDMEVLEIEIPPDHVHALVSLPPRTSVSECVRILKSISAREFFAKYPDIRKKWFWGGKLWSPSYYAESIGKRNEDAITKYIQAQLKDEERTIERLRQLKLLP